MTQQELTLLNLGSSLDDIANIDPRGYGVCKLLYKASREYTGMPLCVNGATKLAEALSKNDLVYLMTGFVLLPSKKGETDGMVGAVLLARSLIKAFGIKPVIICPEENIVAAKNISESIGIGFCDSFEELMHTAESVYAVAFTKDKSKAADLADELIKKGLPKAVISIECPGENEKGVYHNARGIDVTEYEAKQDVLFEKLKSMGVLNIAIGDLGNEIGMGTIGEYIRRKIPYAAECNCSCGGGIAVCTKADNIITATASDWGCYSLSACLAYILENPDIMHDASLEEAALIAASKSNLVDMSGEMIPAIDGFNLEMNRATVSLMKEAVCSALKLKESCKIQFDKIIELDFFDN